MRNTLVYKRLFSTIWIILYMKLLWLVLLHMWHIAHGVPVVVMIALQSQIEIVLQNFCILGQITSTWITGIRWWWWWWWRWWRRWWWW